MEVMQQGRDGVWHPVDYVPHPYRFWCLLNPLWWVSTATEPRWTRAEAIRRVRAWIVRGR